MFHAPNGSAYGPPRPMMNMMPPHVAGVAPVVAFPPLPVGWSEHLTPQGIRYYFHAATGASTYERPTTAIPAAVAVTTPTSVAVPTTSVAAVPEVWVEYKDDASGQKYYYNTITKATTWDEPEEFRMQQARAQVEKMKSSTAASGVVVAEEQKRQDQKRRLADQEAMKQFEKMPKDERVAAFKAFLEENNVSPQAKWQEALRLITKDGLDKDPRWKFALSTVGEKKQAFSEYCTQIVNKQTIEKRRQAKRIREEFVELLGQVETQILRDRVSWDDIRDGAEFFGLRKDPRWLAIDENKDKKDLFDGFVRDAVRKRAQQQAKKIDEFKERFLAKLREKTQHPSGRALFAGKRRVDSELKKTVWQYFDETEGAAEVREAIRKTDMYDWVEQFLEVLKTEESEFWKAEREKKKQFEEEFAQHVGAVVDQWLTEEKMDLNTSWKQIGEELSKECMGRCSAPPTTLSERRQRRVFEKKIKRAREQAQTSLPLVRSYLEKVTFSVSVSSTYEEFALALRRAIQMDLDASKPEEGEEEEDKVDADDGAVETLSRAELERIVQASASTEIVFPLAVKFAFQLLQYQAQRKARHESHRDSSRSPSPSRKRRRGSFDSPRSRSASPHRKSRSRSRSNGRTNGFHARDPRAVLSYGDLPLPSTKRLQHETPVTPVVDEAARAEEIIRQARLKLQAKQAAKQQSNSMDSEPEEGEEIEDGEIDE